jgi:hypothetical protein
MAPDTDRDPFDDLHDIEADHDNKIIGSKEAKDDFTCILKSIQDDYDEEHEYDPWSDDPKDVDKHRLKTLMKIKASAQSKLVRPEDKKEILAWVKKEFPEHLKKYSSV